MKSGGSGCPVIPLRILKRIMPSGLAEGFSGDLEEEYGWIRERRGPFRANAWIWLHVLKSAPPAIHRSLLGSLGMLTNYLKITLRNLRRQKVQALINVVGLAVGIASCILIYLYVRNESSYDAFHTDRDRLYRVYITEDLPGRDAFSYVEAPAQLAAALEESFPEVEGAVRIGARTDLVRFEEKTFTRRMHLVDSDFFEIFSFPLIRGDRAGALRHLNAVVLTESAAQLIFGRKDPMGRTLALKMGETFHDFVIAGIAADPPANSSIRFEVLVPFDNVRKYLSERALSQWFNVFFETYVLLSRPVPPIEMEDKLQFVVNQHYPRDSIENVTLHFQPMLDIHTNPDIPPGFEPTGDPLYARILIVIAGLILAVACINFMTLAVGRSTGRAREVGVRKVLGALKPQLVRQFLGEALLLTLTSLLLAGLLVKISLPAFNAVTGKPLTLGFDPETLIFLAVLLLAAGIFAGGYPAFFLSRHQPVQVMSPEARLLGVRRFVRGLVVGQFALSIGLIACTLVMSDQLRFLLNHDLGFDADQVVVIQNHSPGEESLRVVERLRSRLGEGSGVSGVSAASSAFARDWTRMGFNGEDGTFKSFFQLTVDHDFIPELAVELIEGRNFQREFGSDPAEALIVNQALVQTFQLENPLGKRIPGRRFPPHRIVGVVKDFHFESLRERVAPLAMVLDPDTLLEGINDISTSFSPHTLNFIYIRVRPDDLPATLTSLEAAWKEAAPGHPFLFSFLDEDVARQYREVERWGRIVGYASGLTVLIACLGLFGLASLTVTRRTKEIGIRKVLGASAAGIAVMLSREFGGLVAAANLIAWPLAFLLMRRWLRDFAFRVSVGGELFLAASLLALAIALLTVSYQSIRAAVADPVHTIRHE